jgi:hypothetical protein
MVSLKPKNSAVVTIVVIALSILALCYLVVRVSGSFAACSQIDTGAIDFELLLSCVELLTRILFITLFVCVIVLFCIKQNNSYLNKRGLVWSRFGWLFLSALYIVYYWI